MAVRGLLTIADVAARVGMTPGAIRMAEFEGRIPKARRDQLGHRIYDEQDVERIRRAMAQ